MSSISACSGASASFTSNGTSLPPTPWKEVGLSYGTVKTLHVCGKSGVVRFSASHESLGRARIRTFSMHYALDANIPVGCCISPMCGLRRTVFHCAARVRFAHLALAAFVVWRVVHCRSVSKVCRPQNQLLLSRPWSGIWAGTATSVSTRLARLVKNSLESMCHDIPGDGMGVFAGILQIRMNSEEIVDVVVCSGAAGSQTKYTMTCVAHACSC